MFEITALKPRSPTRAALLGMLKAKGDARSFDAVVDVQPRKDAKKAVQRCTGRLLRAAERR